MNIKIILPLALLAFSIQSYAKRSECKLSIFNNSSNPIVIRSSNQRQTCVSPINVKKFGTKIASNKKETVSISKFFWIYTYNRANNMYQLAFQVIVDNCPGNKLWAPLGKSGKTINYTDIKFNNVKGLTTHKLDMPDTCELRPSLR